MLPIFKTYVSLGIILILFSCNRNQAKKIEEVIIDPINKELISINSKLIGKEIILPELVPLQTKYSTSGLNKSEFTILVYYDGNCSGCFLQLSKWVEMSKILNRANSNINYKFVLWGANEPLIKYNLNEFNIYLDDIYFDEMKYFGENYSFLLEPNYLFSCILLNKNNRILQIGNPINSIFSREAFTRILKKEM